MYEVIYRTLKAEEIDTELFSHFNRYQEVRKCWRKENGKWVLKEIPFTEQWGPEEYKFLVQCLSHTVAISGAVFGAFQSNRLIGFASVEPQFFGSKNEYLQLSSIHASCECRGLGVGKRLFNLAANKAKEMGAKKLYISSHSSEETQAFYKAMGCVEAIERNPELVQKEPYDCQLEFVLSD